MDNFKCGHVRTPENSTGVKRVRCRACVSKYSRSYDERHPGRREESRRRWDERNPGRTRDAIAAWQRAHPEAMDAARQRYEESGGIERAKRARGIAKAGSPEHIAKLAANASKGDLIGYRGIHKKARVELPRECSFCGATKGRLDCALKKETPPESLRLDPTVGCWHSVRVEDYMRLCGSCHVRYDHPRAIEIVREMIVS